MTHPPTQPPEPRVRPTSGATLFVAALAAAAVTWVLVGRYYGDIPPLPLFASLTPGLLAVLEGFTGTATRARIERKPGTQPVEPLMVARYVLIAKASSIAGAITAGAYTALLIWVVARRGQLTAAADDVPVAAIGTAASILLVAAALYLERSCRVPPGKDDTDGPGVPKSDT